MKGGREGEGGAGAMGGVRKGGGSYIARELVLLGGGHAHLFVLKMWGMKPLDHVRLTLISSDVYTPYSGMIPGYISGVYTWEQCHIDLLRLCHFASARFICATAVGIDRINRLVFFADQRPPIRYDLLSIDIGSAPTVPPQYFAPSLHAVPKGDQPQGSQLSEAVLSRAGGGADEERGGRQNERHVRQSRSSSGPSSSEKENADGADKVNAPRKEPRESGSYLTPVKPISEFFPRWHTVLNRIEREAARRWGLRQQDRDVTQPGRENDGEDRKKEREEQGHQAARSTHARRENFIQMNGAPGDTTLQCSETASQMDPEENTRDLLESTEGKKGDRGTSPKPNDNGTCSEPYIYKVVVVGGGAAGVEVCLAMQCAVKRSLKRLREERLVQLGKALFPHAQMRNKEAMLPEDNVIDFDSLFRVEFHIFTKASSILQTFSRSAQARMNRLLIKRGVILHTNANICSICVVPQTPSPVATLTAGPSCTPAPALSNAGTTPAATATSTTAEVGEAGRVLGRSSPFHTQDRRQAVEKQRQHLVHHSHQDSGAKDSPRVRVGVEEPSPVSPRLAQQFRQEGSHAAVAWERRGQEEVEGGDDLGHVRQKETTSVSEEGGPRHQEEGGEGVQNVKGEEVRQYLTESDGRMFSFHECFWCTQAAPQSWLKDTGLELDKDGFIAVDRTLRSVNTPSVFAAGDVASIVGCPRPKAGVYAVRAGPPLDRNLRRVLEYGEGAKLYPWKPQATYLSLVSCGDDYAIGNKGSGSFEGQWVWKLKRFIDLRWMRMYQELPQMSEDLPLDLDGDLGSFFPFFAVDAHKTSSSPPYDAGAGGCPSPSKGSSSSRSSRFGAAAGAQRFLSKSFSSLSKDKTSRQDERRQEKEQEQSRSLECATGVVSANSSQGPARKEDHRLARSTDNRGLLTLLAYVRQVQQEEEGGGDSPSSSSLALRAGKRVDLGTLKKMRCGGCAGKIPSSVLRHALHELQREDQRQATTLSCLQSESHEMAGQSFKGCSAHTSVVGVGRARDDQDCQRTKVAEGDDRSGGLQGGEKEKASEHLSGGGLRPTTVDGLIDREESSLSSHHATRNTIERTDVRRSDLGLLTYREEVLVGLDDADDACVFSAMPPTVFRGGGGYRASIDGNRETAQVFMREEDQGEGKGADALKWKGRDSHVVPESQACTESLLQRHDEGDAQPLLVQTVDFFRSFYDDTYILGRIAATHALSDCYAMGAEPMIALLTAVIPHGSDHVMQNTLLQLLGGCCSILSREHCELVGGHSAEGTDVSAGLTVTGRIIRGGWKSTGDTQTPCRVTDICKDCQKARSREQQNKTVCPQLVARNLHAEGTEEDAQRKGEVKEMTTEDTHLHSSSLRPMKVETRAFKKTTRDVKEGGQGVEREEMNEVGQEEKGVLQAGEPLGVAGKEETADADKGRDGCRSYKDKTGGKEAENTPKRASRVRCPLCLDRVGYLAKGSARAQAGDALILTKALGTGIVMAACMQGKAKGRWVMKALDVMQVSNRKAAEIFMRYGATACTDVTGFGLLGHLVEMLSACRKARVQAEGAGAPAFKAGVPTSARKAAANGDEGSPPGSLQADCDGASHANLPQLLCARLFLSKLPLLGGVMELMADGVHSSLLPGNAKFFSALSQKPWICVPEKDISPATQRADCVTVPASLPVLFDPQTSGGLLAVVPARMALECVASLRHEGGYQDSVIVGHLFEETPPGEGQAGPVGTAPYENMRASVECLT